MIRSSGHNSAGRPTLFLGLDHRDLDALANGQHISFDLSEMDHSPLRVLIYGGKSDDVLLKVLRYALRGTDTENV
jgi:hypothetical protein